MKIVPTKGILLVKKPKVEEVTTASGIIIAKESAVSSEDVQRVIVIDDATKDYSPGTIVYVAEYSLTGIKDISEGEDGSFYFVPKGDVWGVETDKEVYARFGIGTEVEDNKSEVQG